MMGLGPLVETKRLEIQIEQLGAKLAKAEADFIQASEACRDADIARRKAEAERDALIAVRTGCEGAVDDLRLQLRAERAERMTVADELASLRARVREWIAARDKSGGLDPLGGDEVEWIAACKATDLAEAALRAEVERG